MRPAPATVLRALVGRREARHLLAGLATDGEGDEEPAEPAALEIDADGQAVAILPRRLDGSDDGSIGPSMPWGRE